MCKHRYLLLLIPALLALAAQAQTPDVVESPRGETVERNLPTDEPLRPWAHDPNLLQKESGDRVELRPVHAERLAPAKSPSSCSSGWLCRQRRFRTNGPVRPSRLRRMPRWKAAP